MPPVLPYLLRPKHLADAIDTTPGLLIVCLGKYEQYLAGHLRGAVYLDPKRLSVGTAPAAGMLPEGSELQKIFRGIGLGDRSHVVCYDDEAGTGAARMMWVLEAVGHHRQSFLDGGLIGWQALGLPLEPGVVQPTESNWEIKPNPHVSIDRTEIKELVSTAAITTDVVKILDARTPEEHQGLKSASDRKGRIPGAVNLNWLDTTDSERHLKSPEILLDKLKSLGITSDSDIVVHCQTHQRSSHTFMMLRSLGFEKVRGYPGSWSDWAADPETPIETGPPVKLP